jgi:hypothetical protein
MGQIPNESCMSALCLKLYVYGIRTIGMCVCVCVCVWDKSLKRRNAPTVISHRDKTLLLH